MIKKYSQLLPLKNQDGAVAIIVALLMGVFVGFAALAVDISELVVVRNELKNASDAGSLAGARFLYNPNGTSVNSGANQIAHDASVANKSISEGGAVAVEVDWSDDTNGPDVQRGHWCFSCDEGQGEFTPNDSLEPVDLWDVSTEELDQNTSFINAVRVRTTRGPNSPASSFFARIFGIESFFVEQESVAYIGYAGTLQAGEVDQPIAICADAITLNGEYSCNVGRFMGPNPANDETAGWTNLDTDECSGGTNAEEVRSLVCSGGNPAALEFGKDMGTSGGVIQSAFNDLISCWKKNSAGGTEPWGLRLAVIDCPGNNVGVCSNLRGAVELNILWITGSGTDPHYNDIPRQMSDWSVLPDGLDDSCGSGCNLNTDEGRQACWDNFVCHFNLKNIADGSPAPYQKKTIYFLPDCTVHALAGRTGGENFGILAQIPVLVQ